LRFDKISNRYNISPRITSSLEISGFVAVHVNSIGMSASTDEEIFNYAYENNFTIVSADTDFGFILSS
jgi:predicted nuclease of predicted toxin-antitoxin system